MDWFLYDNGLRHERVKGVKPLQEIHAFFYKQNCYKHRQAEIGKNQAKAKQSPKAELLLFGIYLLFIHVIIQK